MSDFELLKKNVSAEKEYKNLYHDLIEQDIFSTDLVDQAYSHKYVKHIYSADELSRLRQMAKNKQWLICIHLRYYDSQVVSYFIFHSSYE